MDSTLKHPPKRTKIPQQAAKHSPSLSEKIFTDEYTQTILKQWREKSNTHEQYPDFNNQYSPEKAAFYSSLQTAEEVPKQKIVSPENTSSYLSKSSRVSNNNSLFFIEAFSK